MSSRKEILTFLLMCREKTVNFYCPPILWNFSLEECRGRGRGGWAEVICFSASMRSEEGRNGGGDAHFLNKVSSSLELTVEGVEFGRFISFLFMARGVHYETSNDLSNIATLHYMQMVKK